MRQAISSAFPMPAFELDPAAERSVVAYLWHCIPATVSMKYFYSPAVETSGELQLLSVSHFPDKSTLAQAAIHRRHGEKFEHFDRDVCPEAVVCHYLIGSNSTPRRRAGQLKSSVTYRRLGSSEPWHQSPFSDHSINPENIVPSTRSDR